MVSTLCVFIGSKIAYFNRYRYLDYIEHYYTNRKGPKGRMKPFDEIKEKLREDFVD